MLKIDLKERIENSSKLIRTLTQIENKLLTIKKQNVNQSIKTKTYTNVIKAITKITKIEKKNENIIKKSTAADMTTTEKRFDHKNRERNEKKEITKKIRYEISKKNQQSYRKRKK